MKVPAATAFGTGREIRRLIDALGDGIDLRAARRLKVRNA